MSDHATTDTSQSNPHRTAIISGAGTGIGSAVARRLASDGFAVAVVWNQSREGAEQTAEAITAAGGEAMCCRADVKSGTQVEQLFSQCLDCWQHIDVVVNNAGIGHMESFAKITDSDYDRIFDTNTRGSFHMCREAAKNLTDRGSIVNISTGMTVSSMAGMALYTASKMALEGFTKTLAHELGPRGINVNSVSPGLTNTPMISGMDSASIKQMGEQTSAMQRLGQPEDIASVVSFLVSADGHWVTGQNIHACGGSIIV